MCVVFFLILPISINLVQPLKCHDNFKEAQQIQFFTCNGNSFFVCKSFIQVLGYCYINFIHFIVYNLLKIQFLIISSSYIQLSTIINLNWMADLSTLFSPKRSYKSPQTYQKSFSYKTQQFPSSPYQNYMSPSSQFGRTRSIDIISNQAKKIITYNNMEQQLTWFQQNNLLEFLTKIFFLGFILSISYFFSLIGIDMVLTVIIFAFFTLGLQHNIFGANLVKKWAFCSLIGTKIVLSNQIFLYTISKINFNISTELFRTYQSLIPAIYIAVLITIILQSLSFVSHTTQTSSILNIILEYPKNLLQLGSFVFKLKKVIAKIYSIMLIITLVISIIIQFRQRNWNNIIQLFGLLFHPLVLLAEFASFILVLLILYFLIKFIGSLIQKLTITNFYNIKNKDTKIPHMLQLLRMNSSNIIIKQRHNQKYPNIFVNILKFLRIDLSSIQPIKAKITRQQRQNIYKHSLNWLIQMLNINANILNTKINTSKFYNTYLDIFRQFIESQLLYCSSALFNLEKSIENLDNFIAQHKTLKEDLFVWARILQKQIQIWIRADQCCKLLAIENLILQIISLAEIDKELWRSTFIGTNFGQISRKTYTLSKNKSLNPVIRDKMEQYYNKASRFFKK